MHQDEAARLLREKLAAPWDDLRALRVEHRVLRQLTEAAVPRWRRPIRLVAVAAAGIVVLALAVLVGFELRGPKVASEALADGSVITRKPGARVLVQSTNPEVVRVVHEFGEALYDVARRPQRDFIVYAGDARIRVIGTAFEVVRGGGFVRVRVLRGRVEVTQGERRVELTANEDLALAEPAESPESPAPTGEPAFVAPPPRSPPPDAYAPPPVSRAPQAGDLFRRADEARARHDDVAALDALHELVRRFPHDARAAMATFTIGRLEAGRGRMTDAASAFESLGDDFDGEAMAEAALAWEAAGQPSRAKAAAVRYLARHPEGPRAAQVQRLAN